MGNPFLEQEPQLVHIIAKKLLDQKAIESVKCAKYIGNHQFKSFFRERLIEGTSSLYNTIKRTVLHCIVKKIVISISKEKVVILSPDCRLYLNIASQTREGDLGEFFAHENHAFPVSISEYDKLRAAKGKSEFT